MAKSPIRIGTRGSPLALWQADWVERALRRAFPRVDFERVIVRTSGDIKRAQPLAAFGGFGVFSRELDEALLGGEIDLAVHSAKDYPTDVADGLSVAAFPCREVANDSIVARGGLTLKDLPQKAVIGTGSLRRAAQLAAMRPDLRFREIRGNIDTRLRKVESGKYDAIVMAEAALRRLRLDVPREVLSISRLVPAAGMGALMIVCRSGDRRIRPFVRRLNNNRVSSCVESERSVLLGLGGGCRLPIGVHARIAGDTLRIRAVVLSPDGRQKIGGVIEGGKSNPGTVARKTIRYLMSLGAREIVDQIETGVNP